jgi:hypothetical protein
VCSWLDLTNIDQRVPSADDLWARYAVVRAYADLPRSSRLSPTKINSLVDS